MADLIEKANEILKLAKNSKPSPTHQSALEDVLAEVLDDLEAYKDASVIGYIDQAAVDALQMSGAAIVKLSPEPLVPVETSEAAEIERLTAELSAARALLAQYEQAPVVGWVSFGLPDEVKHYQGTSVYISNEQMYDNDIALIARPDTKP